ncbi:MAG: YciI family protein [Caulobacteraceae bacterium]
MVLFAALNDYGPAFRRGAPLAEQPDWAGHARFMDDLYERGICRLAGVLGDFEGALVVVEAGDLEEARRLLAPDPWLASGILVSRRLACWNLKLGAIA